MPSFGKNLRKAELEALVLQPFSGRLCSVGYLSPVHFTGRTKGQHPFGFGLSTKRLQIT